MVDRQDRGDFGGLSIALFESRRAAEMASLVARFGGVAVPAPTLREVPIASSGDAVAFARELVAGAFDAVIAMTGIGVRALAAEIADELGKEQLAAALARTKVIARGPKPVAALRELGVGGFAQVRAPNTQHEVFEKLVELDLARPGARVALLEHGRPSTELVASLREAGALVRTVRIYRWELCDDIEPLKRALARIASGDVPVALFTSAAQIDLALGVADEQGIADDVKRALRRGVVGSIGPVCSARLRSEGLDPDVEPEHAKMGHLVKTTAERAARVLAEKA